ncbi:MAG: HAD family hydrolase [Candidatus Methylopumilus sp.]|nr:HAD family hydrolase [Candidatus Methylopumilus sp.]
MLPISQYKTILFDCDGVVLNSNFLKIEAYRLTALEFGASEEDAMKLVKHHIEYTGISRNIKFAYFLVTILHKKVDESSMNHLLTRLNFEVERLLENCEIAKGLDELRTKSKYTNWMIVSGGDQEEINRLFTRKSLLKYFDVGIFGSPDSKEEIVARELKKQTGHAPALFIGDSKYDYQVAEKNNLDFIFLSDWTNFLEWKSFCETNKIEVYKKLDDLNHI